MYGFPSINICFEMHANMLDRLCSYYQKCILAEHLWDLYTMSFEVMKDGGTMASPSLATEEAKV